jgi:type IV pilus assembly protein PilP
MDKFQMAIRWIICLALLVLWTGGCEDKANAPAKPKVVTKKIASPEVAVKPDVKKPVVPQTKPSEATQKVVVAKQVAPVADVKTEKVVASPPVPPTPTSKPVEEAAIPKAAVHQPVAPPEGEVPPRGPTTTEAMQPTILADAVAPQTSLLIYNPIGKIDPFQPLLAQKPEPVQEERKEITRPLTELEKLDLGQLKLTAVIIPATGGNSLAMVEERQTSKGYVVRKGTYIGNNSGQIVEILSDRIILEEEISIGGNIEIRQRELKIQKSGER